MKVVAQIKLDTMPEQADALRRTLEAANAAANYISDHVWDTQTFRQYDLHHALYYDVRKRFGLSAQVTVRIIAKVADAYKLDRKCKRRFNPHGSIAYDRRILSWRLFDRTVSIWTMDGRQRIPFLAGQRQLDLLQSLQGEADLIYRAGEFYLHQVCEIETPDPDDPDEWLGVDLGIVNIATDSDGRCYSGGQVNGLRRRHNGLRARLQSKGTQSAKRLLKKRRQKETRFVKDVNHCISKSLVEKAKDTGRGIALEDLTGIHERITVRKGQRRQQHSWAFSDLRTKIEYKAALAGIKVALIDPRNTSRTCPMCGYVDKRNRPTRDAFSCIQCGFSGHADAVAAVNIGRRAVVNQPNAAGEMSKGLTVNCDIA